MLFVKVPLRFYLLLQVRNHFVYVLRVHLDAPQFIARVFTDFRLFFFRAENHFSDEQAKCGAVKEKSEREEAKKQKIREHLKSEILDRLGSDLDDVLQMI